MKKTIDEKQFNVLVSEFVAPIAKWQKKKPAKRSAMLLCCDHEVSEYAVDLMGNKRAKYPLSTCLGGLGNAMIAQPELLCWVKAHVRYAERELKRKSMDSHVHELNELHCYGKSNS